MRTAQPYELRPNYVYQNGLWVQQGFLKEAQATNRLPTGWESGITVVPATSSIIKTAQDGPLSSALARSVLRCSMYTQVDAYSSVNAATGVMATLNSMNTGDYFSFFIGTQSITKAVYFIVQISDQQRYVLAIDQSGLVTQVNNPTNSNSMLIVSACGDHSYRVACPKIQKGAWSYLHFHFTLMNGTDAGTQVIDMADYQSEAGSGITSWVPYGMTRSAD